MNFVFSILAAPGDIVRVALTIETLTVSSASRLAASIPAVTS